MNSLRPLITITILAVVGAWLYVKINEGPARPANGEPAAWQGQTAGGVPPLAATTVAPPADAGTAPKWPNANAAAPATPDPPAPTTLRPTPAAASTTGLSNMPAIPELPDVPTPSQAAPPATAASSAPVTLPANIPSARYPDQANSPSSDAGASSGGSTDGAPANAANSDKGAVGSMPVAAPQATTPPAADHESAIATDNAMAAVGLSPQPPSANASQNGTNAPPQPPVPGTNRYGRGTANSIDRSLPDTATPPVEPTFAEAWPDVQAALDRGELARAHQLLSKWYGDDSLTPAEAEKLETLLAQLAGTVVYSTEHQLEPAYIVRPGETLESIANSFNVPWQLLAKINGITSANAIQPGQQLKVVRGPFSAVVDLRRSQLTLMVDGRYAGRFRVTPPGVELPAGEWIVEDKPATPSPQGPIYSSPDSSVAMAAPAQPAVLRSIVLRSATAENQGLALHIGPGPAVDRTDSVYQGIPVRRESVSPNLVKVSPADAEELADILSIGSRVVIRR